MRYYTDEHEWIDVEGDIATVGITEYAQGQLGDITYVDLPAEGQAVGKVRAFMLTTADHYTHNRDSWVTGSNAFHTTEESASRAKGVMFRDQYEKHLRNCITEGIKSGEFRTVDPAIAGRLLLSSINSMSRWHKPQGKLSASGVVEQFVDIVLGGLRHH